ncbi:MAG: D-TA family PLP-dependent enzyme [Verrucomicrobiae bacterium]|nr:D-TA family PLP-dependent enzyme [Verrucomicrobiae bacterium]
MPEYDWLSLENPESVASPALLVWPERIDHNIQVMLEQVGGDASLLRPHVKTHKMGEVVAMQLDAGIDRFKCATIAEAEMSAAAGARDVLLAYQPVGPNIARMFALQERFPKTSFAAIVDDARNLTRIAKTFAEEGKVLRIFVDIDCGMGRTGIAPDPGAMALCRQIIESDGVSFCGLHVYDGHIHEPDVRLRGEQFETARHAVEPFLAELEAAGIEVPLVVGGGSPTFPWHARLAQQLGYRYECSPGTTLLWDAGYGTNHPDLGFQAAAALLTRVISKPGSGRLCLELGHKAVSGENPIGSRVRFPLLPDAKPIMQSEEHLVVETSAADRYAVGDPILGIPWHICPTVALHQEAVVVRDGRATGERWRVVARDRRISI